MQTIKEKVAAFAKASGESIFVVDQILFDRHNNNIAAIAHDLRESHPSIFGADLWEEETLSDFLSQAQARKVIRSNKTPNNTQIISFLETERPIIEHLAPSHHHLLDVKNNMLWQDFALYHELFHAADDELQGLYVSAFQPISISTIHRTEFFADFAACLYMASKGHDMFLDVARLRGLNIRENSHKDSFNIRSITYCNHRLYAAYKKENLASENMSVTDIIKATRNAVDRHAFSRHQLDSLRHSVRTTDGKSFNQTIRTMENVRHQKQKHKP